ncbi:hypothetical protein [Halomonas sp. LBP4]|uniref:hypothetical protein n=1 Tax=Halomonas sp. LBP4 TaxID=2044917 RepID=UPI0011B74EBE|nr:hypothetical protein [Halomonas sp. LBP4]
MKIEIMEVVDKALSGIMSVLPVDSVDDSCFKEERNDFIVPPGKAISACRLVAEEAQEQGWFLVKFRRVRHLAEIVLIRPGVRGEDQSTAINFYDGLSWIGPMRDKFSEVSLVDYQGFEHDVRAPRSVCFFCNQSVMSTDSHRGLSSGILTGPGSVSRTIIPNGSFFSVKPNDLDGRVVTGLAKWCFRAVCRGAESAWGVLTFVTSLAMFHGKDKMGFGTDSGILIAVSGLDGAGKTTLVERLVRGYSRAGAEPPVSAHFLPSWIPMPHQIIHGNNTPNNSTRPYRSQTVASPISAALRMSYYMFVFFVTKISLKVSVFRGRQVMLDRGFLDFAVDPTRTRIPVRKLPSFILKLFHPHGLWFFLNASPDVVIERKGELSREKAVSLQKAYLSACKEVGVVVLDGDDSPDFVFRELIGNISSEYLKRVRAAEKGC